MPINNYIWFGICALLGHYAASCSVPEERSSHQHRGGSLKPRLYLVYLITPLRRLHLGCVG
jgi:hypothetical protein